MTKSKQVFISYDHADTSFAHQLAEDLRQSGIKVWIAPESIRPGESWVEAINRGLQESTHMVTVLTPSAIESKWVKMETNVAIALERKGLLRVIPLDVEPCDPPPLWTSYQMIPFRSNYEEALNHLATNLGLCATPPEPVRAPEQKDSPTRPALSMSEMLAKIKPIVTNYCSKGSDIRAESRLIEDLGMDGIDLAEFPMTLEEEFDIAIPPEDSYDQETQYLKLRTVGAWAEYLIQRLRG